MVETADSPLNDDDADVVLGGLSPAVNEALIAESSENENVVEDVVVEDIVGGDDYDLKDKEQEMTSSESKRRVVDLQERQIKTKKQNLFVALSKLLLLWMKLSRSLMNPDVKDFETEH
jgi:hypothetical protein